jgi:hypothetical protein
MKTITLRGLQAGKCLAMLAMLVLPMPLLHAQQAERWFQVEVSIFTHENLRPDAEFWNPEPNLNTPGTARRLTELSQVLALSEWAMAPASQQFGAPQTAELQEPPAPLPGPPPYNGASTFKLPDLERDAFIMLPPQQSAFTDSNRALERSPSHRLLYHALWRQPVYQTARSIPVLVSGGRLLVSAPAADTVLDQDFNSGFSQGQSLNQDLIMSVDEGLGEYELGGTLRFRFNPAGDRVILDANIWLRQPFAGPNDPSAIQMIQSREMRSNEFHYLDHPAAGIVVMVQPYSVPPLSTAEEMQDEAIPQEQNQGNAQVGD